MSAVQTQAPQIPTPSNRLGWRSAAAQGTKPRRLSVRFAAAVAATLLLSGCAVQICGPDYPYQTNSCSADASSE